MPHHYPIRFEFTGMKKGKVIHTTDSCELKILVGSSRSNSEHLATMQLIKSHDDNTHTFLLSMHGIDIAKAVFKNNRGTAGKLISITRIGEDNDKEVC